MNIVVPMAGQGKRFRMTQQTLPKMMIPVAGRPMLYWALDSLRPWLAEREPVFICLREHLEAFPLERLIRAYGAGGAIVALDEPTEGQAQTVFSAADALRDAEPLLVYNCDTYTRSGLHRALSEASLSGTAGVLSVFRAADPALSYALPGEDGFVRRVEEKRVISPFATTGLYYFARASLLLDEAAAAVAAGDKAGGEYYIAPLYNRLIARGLRIALHEEAVCRPLGTPAEAEAFAAWLRADGLGRTALEAAGLSSEPDPAGGSAPQASAALDGANGGPCTKVLGSGSHADPAVGRKAGDTR